VRQDGSGPGVAGGFGGAVLLVLGVFLFAARQLGVAEASQLVGVLRRRASVVESESERPGEPDAVAAGRPADGAGGDDADVAPLLHYPDPNDPNRTPASTIPEGDIPVGHVVAGQILNARYRLDEPLHRRGSALTWRGFDIKLSRPVLIHVMHPDEPRALEILDQARRAAPAVDSRFLRVWDAVLVEDEAHGSYIVCEYAPGQSLELALRQGTFTDLEAAWVVREVASGLVAMHAQGLYHRQLNPDTVVITASGNVKIVGFLVENALHPHTEDGANGEQADVLALGHLLYAATIGRWPGGARYGLPAAPTDSGGRLLLPRQVTARVSSELSDVVDRIVSRTPRGRASRLTSAQDIDHALSHLLRGQEQSHALDRRLRFPVTTVKLTAPKPPKSDLLASPLALGDPTPHLDAPIPEVQAPPGFGIPASLRGNPDARPAMPAPRASESERGEASEAVSGQAVSDQAASGGVSPDADDDGTQRWSPDERDGDSTQAFWFDDADEAGTDRFTPIPPPAPAPASGTGSSGAGAAQGSSSPGSARTPSSAASRASADRDHRGDELLPHAGQTPPHRWYGYLLGLFMLALVVGLVMVFTGAFEARTRTPAERETYAIAAARDFDPSADGGDDTENPELAPLAVDGDPTTAWTTERYGRTATFNDRKPGAGVIVDLGERRPVGWVRVVLGSGSTSGDIRVPADPNAAVPPLASEQDWRTVASFDGASDAVELELTRTAETRYVLVYLTQLPRVEPNFQGTIFEITVAP
ncbi:MAG: protein kinase family protein, partial [Propionibacteriaceae bacterium]|nr:protein kinase family protein [Propionibacteriaceae bacterium]